VAFVCFVVHCFNPELDRTTQTPRTELYLTQTEFIRAKHRALGIE